MPKFYVQAERSYTARHRALIEVDADSAAAARAQVAAGIQSGAIDPSDSYIDLGRDLGYDDCESWQVDDCAACEDLSRAA